MPPIPPIIHKLEEIQAAIELTLANWKHTAAPFPSRPLKKDECGYCSHERNLALYFATKDMLPILAQLKAIIKEAHSSEFQWTKKSKQWAKAYSADK